MIKSSDVLLAAEMFAICCETNCEVESMKAANVSARIDGCAMPFSRERYLAVLARHEARIGNLEKRRRRPCEHETKIRRNDVFVCSSCGEAI